MAKRTIRGKGISTKRSGQAIVFESLPKSINTAFRNDIFPKIRDDMIELAKQKMTVFNENGVFARQNFKIPAGKSTRGRLLFKLQDPENVSPFLVSGVSQHGPVYVGGWVEAAASAGKLDNPDSFKRADGSYTEFIEIGGAGSRIKRNQSQRDVWNPVLDKYFNEADGKGYRLLFEQIYKDLKRKIR